MGEKRRAAIEARAKHFKGVPRAVTGTPIGRFWLDVRQTTAPGAGGTLAINSKPINDALMLAQVDVPALLAEVRRLRETVDILWYTMNRDTKPFADEALEEKGLPEVEPGYRFKPEAKVP